MFRFFISELKRMIKSKYLLFGFLVSFIGLSIELAFNLQLYFTGIDLWCSIFEKWIGISPENFGSWIFYWLLPLSVSIPFAWTMRDEMNSGYINQVLTRIKKRDYFFTKWFVSFFSGAVIAAGSLLIQFFVLSFFVKAIYPQPNDQRSIIMPISFMSTLYYDNPYLYVLIWTIIASVWCGAIAGLCTAISFFVKKKALVVISAQIIFIVQSVIIETVVHTLSLPWFNLAHASATMYDSTIFKGTAILIVFELLVTAVMGKLYESV